MNMYFFRPSYLQDGRGNILKAGSKVKLPQLARTLRRIAEHGSKEFYTGSLADDIAADIREIGGPHN